MSSQLQQVQAWSGSLGAEGAPGRGQAAGWRSPGQGSLFSVCQKSVVTVPKKNKRIHLNS